MTLLCSCRYQKIACLEVREGTSYQPGCSLMSSNDIQEIPLPIVQPEYTPIDKDHLSQCQFAFFDLETTGLGMIYFQLWKLYVIII